MGTKRNIVLMAGVAASALTLGAPAFAFNDVDWNWNQNVNTNVTVNANVTTDIATSGLTDLEKLQLEIGDITATSTIDGVTNNQPSAGGNGTVSFQVDWAGGYDPTTGQFTTPDATLEGGLTGSGAVEGAVNESGNSATFQADFTDIPVNVTGAAALDAMTELPQVASTATAVGNNESITSQVGTQLEDTQVLFGGFTASQPPPSVPDPSSTGLTAALAMVIAGANGIITPSTVSADSEVSNITNASVDSAATAVGNNANVEVDAATPGDAMLIGDLSQVAYANVDATSNVSDVSLSNYTNLGSLDHPIVSSAATAVGNNIQIKVNAPAPATGP